MMDDSHGNGWHDSVDKDKDNGNGNGHADTDSPLDDIGHTIPQESVPETPHDNHASGGHGGGH